MRSTLPSRRMKCWPSSSVQWMECLGFLLTAKTLSAILAAPAYGKRLGRNIARALYDVSVLAAEGPTIIRGSRDLASHVPACFKRRFQAIRTASRKTSPGGV